MADDSLEDRRPRSEPSDQQPYDDEDGRLNRSSSRRRMMIASLLTAPAVMTLGARAARSQQPTQKGAQTTTSCITSHTANPHTSAHCQ